MNSSILSPLLDDTGKNPDVRNSLTNFIIRVAEQISHAGLDASRMRALEVDLRDKAEQFADAILKPMKPGATGRIVAGAPTPSALGQQVSGKREMQPMKRAGE